MSSQQSNAFVSKKIAVDFTLKLAVIYSRNNYFYVSGIELNRAFLSYFWNFM